MEGMVRSAVMVITLCACAAALGGCGMRVPPPAGAPRGTPFVSWVVMTGDRDNPDAQFVCQSAPRTACVLPASRPNAQVWSSVYFYYHGIGADVKYTGSIGVGFFEGPATELHEVHPDILVTKNDNLGRGSITDDVRTTPGTYALTFDVVATAGSMTTPIRETVTVVVK
jgi:hypothetical protein